MLSWNFLMHLCSWVICSPKIIQLGEMYWQHGNRILCFHNWIFFSQKTNNLITRMKIQNTFILWMDIYSSIENWWSRLRWGGRRKILWGLRLRNQESVGPNLLATYWWGMAGWIAQRNDSLGEYLLPHRTFCFQCLVTVLLMWKLKLILMLSLGPLKQVSNLSISPPIVQI